MLASSWEGSTKITAALTVACFLFGVGTSQAQDGSVLCIWAIYVGIQQGVEICPLDPQPSDIDMQRSIERIEKFALANSTRGLTQTQLDEYKRDDLEVAKTATPQNFAAFCSDMEMMRNGLGSNVTEMTDRLLSERREPEMGSCL